MNIKYQENLIISEKTWKILTKEFFDDKLFQLGTCALNIILKYKFFKLFGKPLNS